MEFRTPPRVIFGRGTVEKARDSLRGRGIIITGPSVWKRIEDLVPLDLPVVEFRRRNPNGEPLEEDVDKLREEVEGVDYIVAIGGGSVIDSVKILRAMLDGSSWEEIYAGKIKRSGITLVSVETTSGTGTGVSAAAVVIGRYGKKGIVHPNLMSDVAIYDPNLVMSMPERVTINSGMDALTHAIEAYVSNVRNVISDTLALKAVELIYHNLRDSVRGYEEAREKIHYGNMLAGMGFTNSRLGLCHAASHKLGGRYGIEHGRVNAILLPYFVRANENYTDAFKDVARVMEVEDVASAIAEMNGEFGIPNRIDMDDIEGIAREIYEDKLMSFNPRKMEVEDIERFLRAVKEGNLDEV